MSAIDQAFLRAYQSEQTTAAQSARAGQSSAAMSAPHFPADRETPNYQPPVVEDPIAEQPNQRRPLSAFAKPGPTVEARFKPALEVDRFRWPAVCEDLLNRYALYLQPAVEALIAADDAGRSLIGIGAAASGSGCTTVLACLARMLVQAGKTVAVVDGDFTAPGLAAQLGLAVQTGWEDVLSGGVPLAESVVYSLGDCLALLPLVRGGAASAERLETIHASVTAGVLRYHYDLVLFDLGAVLDRVQGPIASRLAVQCRLDGLLLTSGQPAGRSMQPQAIQQMVPDLASLCFGVIENQLRAA
jgi:Mrp family chromosome partitioning ATPase